MTFRITGGCQCGAVRYALLAPPESTVCHCRMCQKAVGGPFAALCKVPVTDLVFTRGSPARFRSSTEAERLFCAACGTPLGFAFLGGEAIEVTTASVDAPRAVPPMRQFGIEARLPWIDLIASGTLPEEPTIPKPGRSVRSLQHPDRDTEAG
ncbi:MAG: GFA family protein [Rhodospirillales bacterium]|nr:GFA family protein [Rhodospirillales bacterium]